MSRSNHDRSRGFRKYPHREPMAWKLTVRDLRRLGGRRQRIARHDVDWRLDEEDRPDCRRH